MAAERQHLIRELWPDKTLFATILLIQAGLGGFLFWLTSLAMQVDYAERIPWFLRNQPPWYTPVACLLTVALAYAGWRMRDVRWSFVGVVAGVASFGLVGMTPILSLVALVYIVFAVKEKEHVRPATKALSAKMWPDKSLAAGQLLLVNGILTFGWGAALATGWVIAEFASQWIFGMVALLLGLACIWCAFRLYNQQAPWLSVAASVAAFLCVGFWVVGPILSLATLVLILLAAREREFQANAATSLAG